MSSPTDPLIGQVLAGQYKLEEALGQGGMGTVYRATQLSVGRSVAVKVINADALSNDQIVKRFAREAQTLSKLNHPNTVRLFDYGATDRQQPFMVMELLHGTDVSTEIATRGAIDYQRALRILLQVLRALEEAHGLGVTHRDLKPSNIFLTAVPGSDVHARVLDFGIAGLEQGEDGQKLTITGLVVGSAAYMSPEQAQGQPVGPASDLYSLGAVLFEMLTGTPPFKAETLVSMLVAHITQLPPRLEVARPEIPVPSAVQALLDELLAKTPEARPASAKAVAERIEQILSGDDQAPKRVGVRAQVAARMAMQADEAQALVAARLDDPSARLPPSGTPRTVDMVERPAAARSNPGDGYSGRDNQQTRTTARSKSNQGPLYAAAGGLAVLLLASGAWFALRNGDAPAAPNAALSSPAAVPTVVPAPVLAAPSVVITPEVIPTLAAPLPTPSAANVAGPAQRAPAPTLAKANAPVLAPTPTPLPTAQAVKTPPVVAPPAPIVVAPPVRATDPDLTSTNRAVRRHALLRNGTRYTTVAAAKSALASGALTRDGYEDTIWVLKNLREDALRSAKADYRARKIDKEQYRARVDDIENKYRGL